MVRLAGNGGTGGGVSMMIQRPRQAQPSTPLRVRLPAEPRNLVMVRRALRDWLPSTGMASERVDDVVLAVTEVCSNAIEHGYRDRPGTVHVEGWATRSAVHLVVTDHGRWRPPRPDPGEVRGRGLRLVRALVPEVRLETGSTGTSVELRLPLSG
ncbi:ATP-binding protein [Nocardia otitidiscaviarum]|nr:ATP-binding protein [Nocardia otitidiscaviarum]MCP9620071.1 ATP-binding protein [Nocardia otitidiscaviarum]